MASLTVWTEPLADSNCYLLEEDGACLIVDPNDPEALPPLLEERGWTPEIIFLTHEHCDHMAGLEVLRTRYPSARVVATTACNGGIQNKRLNMSGIMEVYLTYHGRPGVSYPPFVCRPVETPYEEGWGALWRGHRLLGRSLPGHTPGSAGLLLDEDTFFSGDYLLPGQEVILRLPGGSRAAYESQTKPFLAQLRPGLRICPGHGGIYTLTRKEMEQHGV